VINSNLGRISHRLRDTATYSLKLLIKKPLQMETWLLYWQPIRSRGRPIR